MRVTIQTVSRLTGLSADTIRIWERRYTAVSPERSPRGVRMYSEQDVFRLQLLGKGVRRGERISSLAKLNNDQLRKFIKPLAADAQGTLEEPPAEEEQRREAAAAQFERSAASEQLLSSLHDSAARTVAKGLGVEFAAIFELDDSYTALKLCSQFGYGEIPDHVRVPLESNTLPAFALSRNQPVLMTDRARETRFELVKELRSKDIQSALGVPYGAQNHVAVITAHSLTPRLFNEDDIEFVKSIARILMVAGERADADRELHRANEAMSSLMGAVGDGFVILNEDRLVTYANPAFLTRSPEKDVIGKRAEDILPHLREPENFKAVCEALTQSRTKRYEFYSHLLQCWFEAIAQPISGGLAMNFRDVSLRKITEFALEGKSAFAKMLLRSIPGAFWTTDTRLIVLTASGKLLRLLGIAKKDIVGHHVATLFGARAGAEILNGHVLALQGKSAHVDVSLPAQPLRVFVEPLRDSSPSPVGTIAFAIATASPS